MSNRLGPAPSAARNTGWSVFCADLLAGFVGTQRVWFARVYGGERLHGREIASLTRSFIGRFIALGLVVGVVMAPMVAIIRLLDVGTRVASVIIAISAAIFLDAALTFVVPALALTTRSTRDALGIGLRMMRQEWPASAWYILTPGLTLVLGSNLVALGSFRPNPLLRIALLASTSILALVFKGAIVSFYVRRDPTNS